MPIGEALNLRTEEITIVEPKGVDVAVHPEFIFVAGAIEEYAPDDMPDRPDDQEAADQHEVASLLQQRPEIALEIRRPRARMLGVLGLHQFLHIFPATAMASSADSSLSSASSNTTPFISFARAAAADMPATAS